MVYSLVPSYACSCDFTPRMDLYITVMSPLTGQHYTASILGTGLITMMPTFSICHFIAGWMGGHFYLRPRLGSNWQPFGYLSHALPSELLGCHFGGSKR